MLPCRSEGNRDLKEQVLFVLHICIVCTYVLYVQTSVLMYVQYINIDLWLGAEDKARARGPILRPLTYPQQCCPIHRQNSNQTGAITLSSFSKPENTSHLADVIKPGYYK